MKPTTPFLILALAIGLSGCQTVAPDAMVADGGAAPETVGDEADLTNLDDFYRDKLGIDPRILYAQRNVNRVEKMAAGDRSASGAYTGS